MIVSSPTLSVCSLLQPELWKLTGKRLCISSDGSCHQVFSRENKRKTERKLFIGEHRLQCCALFSASLFSTSPPPFVFHLFFFSISLLFFSHSVSSPLSLPLPSLARSPLSSPSRLCLLPSQISSSLAWNMNILELRSLKGTMKWPRS